MGYSNSSNSYDYDTQTSTKSDLLNRCFKKLVEVEKKREDLIKAEAELEKIANEIRGNEAYMNLFSFLEEGNTLKRFKE